MSLQVIKLDSINDKFTVDNDIITVDNNLITVDTTAGSGQEYTIKFSYRKWSNLVNLYLWNELKEQETIIEITPDSEPGIMILKFSHNFLDGESYEVRVLDKQTNELVYRGKILATIQSDLQNYKLHKVTSNKVYKI